VRLPIFNGTTDLTNLQLLHGYCHDQRSALDGSTTRRDRSGLHVKNRALEEPTCRESGTVGFADKSFPRGSGLVQHEP
jgi:hypothetical protein